MIAVLLASGALGAWVSSRNPAHPRSAKRLLSLLVLAAIWLSAATRLMPILAEELAPPLGTNPADARVLLGGGGLACALLLLAIPSCCASFVTPVLCGFGLRLGIALLSSTLGAICAVALSSGQVLDSLGPRGCLQACAIMFLLAAALIPRVGKGIGWVAIGLVMAAPELCVGPDARPWNMPPDGSKETHLHAVAETDYQHVHVSDVRRADGALETRLALDEGLGEFHSLRVHGGDRTGQYYDLMGLAVAESREGARVLVLGGGAATQESVLRAQYGTHIASIHSIEIDASLSRWIPLFAPQRQGSDRWLAGDARRGLAACAGSFDAILLDAFAHQLALPAHLATTEFVDLLNSRLNSEGVLALNVSCGNLEGPLMGALLATLSTRFAGISIWPVRDSWSAVVLCTKSMGHPVHQTRRDLGGAASAAVALRWTPARSTVSPCTDDCAPLESLARKR